MVDYKRNYHPLVIILFVGGMLSIEELNQLSKTTKNNWKQFEHENYFGYQWVEKYLKMNILI